MLIDRGSKVLIAHRRLFDGDAERFFVGEVEAYDGGVIKVRGQTWAPDTLGQITKKDDERVKLVSLSSGTILVYELPQDTRLGSLAIETNEALRRTFLTDGHRTVIDLTEAPPPGRR